MNKNKSLSLIVLVMFFASSCKVMSLQNYESLLATQDSLSNGWDEAKLYSDQVEGERDRLKIERDRLMADTARLQQHLEDLQKDLLSSSGKADRLAADLASREQRLKEVEDILRKRDEASEALKNKLQEALLGFKESGLGIDIRDGKVYVSLTDKLLFSSGSIVIDKRGLQVLAELAKVLKTQPEINIAVEGHTDNQRVSNLGQIKDNWDLSVLRATSVVRFLTESEQINPVRLTATGKGQFQPIELGETDEARSKNRRIEIVLSPKLDEIYQMIK